MPPEHAITALPGVSGLISLSVARTCLLPLGHVSRAVRGVDLEFFFIAPIPPVDSSIGAADLRHLRQRQRRRAFFGDTADYREQSVWKGSRDRNGSKAWRFAG
jgi:hypothetical protein